MGVVLRLEDRELVTMANLITEALPNGEKVGSYYARSLVRLALVIDQQGRKTGWPNRVRVLNDAPAWVYRYFARPIIELAAPQQDGAKGSGARSQHRRGVARKARRATPKPAPAV